MKIESYIRIISRNIEIINSGFRFYSVNTNGKNVTRLSIFLQDSMASNLRDESSESSDFEFQIDKQAITAFTGPKGTDGKRNNACQITLVNDGSILLYHYDTKATNPQTLVRRLKLTADGCSEHTIYDKKNNPIYTRTITRNSACLDSDLPHKVSVIEHVFGDYELVVDGDMHITSGNNLELNGNNVFTFATSNYAVQSKGHFIDFDVQA
jgi:hypothetical protein